MAYQVRQYQNAKPLTFVLVSDSDHRTPVLGATPTVTLSKAGGPFAAPHGAVTEVGNGLYIVAPDYYDSDTLGVLALHAEAPGCDDRDEEYEVTKTDQAIGATHEQFDVVSPMLFLIIASSDHLTGLVGAAPVVQLSRNGAAFSVAGGLITEVGFGWYALTPILSDINILGPLVLHIETLGGDPQDPIVDIVPAYTQTVSQLLVEDVLDMMRVLDNELKLDATADTRDVSASIAALNMALRQLDMIVAANPRIMQTTTDFSTTANQEWSQRPLNLLRLDALWRLDPDTGDQVYELEPVQHAGGQRSTLWPVLLTSVASASAGAPAVYDLNSQQFLWAPKPDRIYPMRIFGYVRTPRLISRTSPWYHTDETAMVVASLAVRYLNTGVADETVDLQQLAAQIFHPLLRSLRKTDRSRPQGRYYSHMHTT